MFFYGKNATYNVVADLAELEKAVGILLSPGSSKPADVSQWKDYGMVLAEVMATGGTFHIAVPKDGTDGWRAPLPETPEPYRSRIENALGFFAQLYGQSIVPENVDVIC